jgi:hypothetical protein
LNLRLFVRNDGREEVRINPTGLWGAGLSIVLTDANGNKFPLEGRREVRGLEPRIRLAPNRIYECQFLPIQTIVPRGDGSPSTRMFRPTGWVLNPGRYQVELEYRVGVFEISSDWRKLDPCAVPAPGEWTGTLKATPMEIGFGPLGIKSAKPGDMVELSTRHRLQFEKGKVSLAHYCNWPNMTATREVKNEKTGEWEITAWGPTHDVWETKDPSGDFLAAWDVGGTRLWYVDRKGIQYLEIHRKLHDRGHWTMKEAGGALADMPEGVRKALNLPARAVAEPGVDIP